MNATMDQVSTANQSVGMGQVAVGRTGTRLTAVLGSCIGVTLFHPRLRIAAMAHVVLPHHNGQTAPPGKFADTAIPHMISALQAQGAGVGEIRAKIAGGACMFGSGGPIQIGAANAEAVIAALEAVGVRLVGNDLGGKTGRRITLDCGTGEMTVETAGANRRIL